MAEIRCIEAKALLDAKSPPGAYYLAGYAVECGLKACISKLTKEYDFPDKEFVNQIHTHKLERLVEAAGLRASKDFRNNWDVVKDWSEQRRYDIHISEKTAIDFWTAVTDPKAGYFNG